MINSQVIVNCIKDSSNISGVEFAVYEHDSGFIASTREDEICTCEAVHQFIESDCDQMSDAKGQYLRVKDADEELCILYAQGEGNIDMVVSLVAASLKNVIVASRERVDRNTFFQNLLLGNMLSVDVHNWSKRLHIKEAIKRCVFVIEPMNKSADIRNMVKELFSPQSGDFVTEVDEEHIVVIKAISQHENEEMLVDTANMLVDMIASEAMTDVRVAYGTVTEELKGISEAYKEARMALEVGRIFYADRKITSYQSLGIGRLIFQLPTDLCSIFVKEIFRETSPKDIDSEILATADKFFENNLNVSETSRQLFIHRNTLIYRIEKLEKITGLDIRKFDDALTFKIALMVVNYLNFRA